MNKLTYSFAAALLFSVAATGKAIAPEDTGARVVSADMPAALQKLKMSYTSLGFSYGEKRPLNVSSPSAVQVVSRDGVISDESPRNKTLTLLSVLALIFVIGKRRFSTGR